MSEKYHNVIGIDLGTTYSAISTFNKYTENTEIIMTEKEALTIPSVVSYDRTNKKVFAGLEAKLNYPVDPDNTIVEIKREMGELVNEKNIQQLQKLGLNPRINMDPYRVPFAEEWYLPQEISAFILMEIKEVAQKRIGEDINDAVITVPAYFTEKQKKATEEAALLAGLYPRQLIPEPTAAAICYGVDKNELGKKTYLVYDLGGGTFDVSIIEVEDNKIIVIATSGDSRLGGSDFDLRITNWVIKQLKDTYQLDISENRLAVAKIKAAAEDAKIILGQFEESAIDLSFLNDSRIPNIKITRSEFENLIKDLLSNSLTNVDEAIQIANKDKGISKDKIDKILLVGGSTKIPKVRQLLMEYFGKGDDFVSTEANPDTVVARGAAILAKKFEATPNQFEIKNRKKATLMSKDTEQIDDPVLITEHSLGIGTVGDKVAHIIERGRILPAKQVKDGFTNAGPSEYIPVPIYQGESKDAFNNTLIGTLNIGPMEPKPAGEHQFEVLFNIDKNGLLAMTINHINENKSYDAKFDQKTGIGGDEKLAIVRYKLLDLFWHKSILPGGSEKPPKPAPHSGTKSSEYPVPPPIVKADKKPIQASKIEDVEYVEMIEDNKQQNKPVPAEFLGTVSLAKTLIQTLVNEELIGAYDRFIALLNKGVSGSDLDDAGDELADCIDKINKLYKDGLLIAKNPIPAEFEELVSLSQSKWNEAKDKVLQKSYNDFILAINLGKPVDEVIENGDKLADILESIGKNDESQLTEPKRDIPDNFKMLVRRSNKQVLKYPDPKLIEAYNAFIKGINTNVSENELNQLNVQLDKAFQNAKTQEHA